MLRLCHDLYHLKRSEYCYIYLNLGATPILEGDPEIWHQKGGADENSNIKNLRKELNNFLSLRISFFIDVSLMIDIFLNWLGLPRVKILKDFRRPLGNY